MEEVNFDKGLPALSRRNKNTPTLKMLDQEQSKDSIAGDYIDEILEPSAQSLQDRMNSRARRDGMTLDDELTYEKLQQLEKIFTHSDTDRGGSLDTDEFRKAVRHTMGKHLTDQELDHMFMKVDTNCDGTVDWDEYLSYMLLEYKEKDTMNMMTQALPLPKEVQVVPNMNRYQRHHDSIVRLRLQPSIIKHANNLYKSYLDSNSGKYISISKHGIINFWGLKLNHLRKHQLPPPKLHNKKLGLWVTDFVCVPNLNMIAVSTTAGTITFYDLTAYSFDTVLMLADLEICVTCMNYWVDPDCPSRAKLLWGDVRGNVMALEFDECSSICFLQPTINKNFKRRVEFSELMKQTTCGVTAYKLNRIHDDMVIEVKYVDELFESVLSCCRSKEKSLHVGDLKLKRSSYFQVTKGVQTFDYSSRYNMIVTAGKDAMIRMWNPYTTVKPVMVLQGSKSPILFVYIHDDSEHIFSVSQEKEIHVFDMDSQICIQTLYRKWITIGTRLISALIFNPFRKALLLGNNKLAIFEHKEKDIKSLQLVSHSTGVTHVLYNELFDQVVSGGSNSLVVVWDADTGARNIQFYTHLIPQIGGGNLELEITAMRFDPTQRRLITAARDGLIKFWNHNNGGLLRTLSVNDTNDITGIVCMKERIITAGWNRRITIYYDKLEDENTYFWKKKHNEDITCITSNKPSTIVTASYDGDILLWMLETGHVTLYFNAHISDKPISVVNRRNEDIVDEIENRKMFIQSDSESEESDNESSASEADESMDEHEDDEILRTFMAYNTHRASIAAPIPQLPQHAVPDNAREKIASQSHAMSAPPAIKGGVFSMGKPRRPSAAFESKLQPIADGGALNLRSASDLEARSSGNLKASSSSMMGGHKSKKKRDSILDSNFDLQKHLEDLMNKNNITTEDDEENENNDNNNINDFNSTKKMSTLAEVNTNNKLDIASGKRNDNNNNDGRFKIKRLLNISKAQREEKGEEVIIDKAAEARRKYDLYLRKNEASILKLVFLENRVSDKDTATLVSASSGGWIRFWVVEHSGGLMGQFNAAHHPGESVATLCVDKENDYLFTGDTEGYIKVWDISEYCLPSYKLPYRPFNYKQDKYDKFPLLTQCDGKLKEKMIKQSRFRPPPLSTNPDVTWTAPELLNSFKGHTYGVSGIAYIDASERLITCSGDCSVRMWTIYGQFIGIYGQNTPWKSLINFEDATTSENRPFTKTRRRRGLSVCGKVIFAKVQKRILPQDIRAVGSAATLRVLNNGVRPRWKLARNILLYWLPLLKKVQKKRQSRLQRFVQPAILIPEVPKQILKRQGGSPRTGRFKPWQLDLEGVRNEIKLMNEKERTSDILGMSYRPLMTHKPFPKLPKIRQFQTQCDVYSSLPFFELASVDKIFNPPEAVSNIIEKNILLLNSNKMVRTGARKWKYKSAAKKAFNGKVNDVAINRSTKKKKKTENAEKLLIKPEIISENGSGEAVELAKGSRSHPGTSENVYSSSRSISLSTGSRDSKTKTKLPPISD